MSALIIAFLTLLLSGSTKSAFNCSKYTNETIRSYEVRQVNQITQWAVVALIPATVHHVETMRKRNALLARYLSRHPSNENNVSILIFSESTFENRTYEEWDNDFKNVTRVQFIDTSSLGFNRKDRFGYHYMCKFFMLDIYEFLKPYDYYWRLDGDCFLLKLNFNIFDWMKNSSIEYAYATKGVEQHKQTKETLPPWLLNYTNQCAIIPTALLDNPLDAPVHFYNNFHLGSVAFFQRPDVQHFLLSVNDSGYLTTHRWGDAPLQGYAVRLFMDPKAVQKVPGLEYVHGSHRIKVVDGASSYVRGIISRIIQTNITELMP
jgi:hypothetical protein